ncbi:MAG: LPS assembly lipoprotein LptE [Vicinamibacteria bacterium]|jgi:hypothetical protein|nr:LPS assembly lipoprotein LptE [Vicinamibacteria bacterium]
MSRLRVVCALLAAAALSLQSCGYALVGRGVSVDPDIKKIGVPMFKDLASGKPGLDQRITRQVIDELLRRGRFQVVQESEGVDALVDGEITGYNETPVGYDDPAEVNTNATASRYAVTVYARVKYTKKGVAEPLWSNDAFSVSEHFEVSGTGLIDPEQAFERLSTEFAQRLVADMLEAF